MTRPGGPLGVGGFEEYLVPDDQADGEGYAIRFYPDLNNEALQQEGQAPIYYWAPQGLRLARFSDTGDFKFSHTHFAGILDEGSHVGIDGQYETVGGLLAFTTTSRVPPAVMQQATEQIRERARAQSSPFWRWFGSRDPQFTMVPINENRTEISTLSPGSPPPSPPDSGEQPEDRLRERGVLTRRGLVHGVEHRSNTNLDAWAVQLDGEGKGSITGGENAYGGLVGMIPSEVIWQAMHGAATPFFVKQHLLIPMATPVVTLKIYGQWRSIFEHFSAAAKTGGLFWSADISVEVEKMTKTGTLEVEVVVDKTVPDADKIEQDLLKDKDFIVKHFTAMAQKTIFDPAPPQVAAAEAKKKGLLGGLFGGFGGAMKLVKKETRLELKFEETRIYKYVREDVISSTLEGMRRELQANPESSGKYFHRVVLGDLSRNVRRVVKPTFAPGDAAHRMAVEVGYPTKAGTLAWKGGEFARDGGADQRWEPKWVMWPASDVDDPPDGWTPDQTWVRKHIFFDQDSDIGSDPNIQFVVERDEMVLGGEDGEIGSDIAIDVRSEDGTLDILMSLDAYLDGPRQRVEVEVQPRGETLDGKPRDVHRFVFNHTDQDVPRRLKIYTGDPDYEPAYDYRVTAMIMAGLGESGGQRWTGPWEPGLGNGPISLSVPLREASGVTIVRMTPEEVIAGGPSDRPDRPTAPDHAEVGIDTTDDHRDGGLDDEPADWPAERRRSRHEAGVKIGGYDVTEAVATPPQGSAHSGGEDI